jgi:hypothetical protein
VIASLVLRLVIAAVFVAIPIGACLWALLDREEES